MRSKKTYVVRRKILLSISFFGIVSALFLFVFIRNTGNWDGTKRLTLVVQLSVNPKAELPSSLALFTLEPQTKKSYFITFPSNTLLSVPYGFGEYPSSSVYSLGELDKRHRGGDLIGESFERTLGVSVDSYIYINNQAIKKLPTSQEDVLSIKKQFFSYRGLLSLLPFIIGKTSQVDTSLSIAERWRLYWTVKQLRADQITYLDASRLDLLEQVKRPDGSVVFLLAQDRFDLLLSDVFTDHAIISQTQTVAVVNASGQTLLAATIEKILNRLGANVITKSTAKDIIADRCTLRIAQNSERESYLVKKLAKKWGCMIQEGIEADTQYDIEITFGEGFVR